jgi:hypothetical protein
MRDFDISLLRAGPHLVTNMTRSETESSSRGRFSFG